MVAYEKPPHFWGGLFVCAVTWVLIHLTIAQASAVRVLVVSVGNVCNPPS